MRRKIGLIVLGFGLLVGGLWWMRGADGFDGRRGAPVPAAPVAGTAPGGGADRSDAERSGETALVGGAARAAIGSATVIVEDAHANGVSGAAVFSIGEAAREPLGVTGAKGRLVVSADYGGAPQLGIVASGFAKVRLDVPTPPPAELRCTLSSGARVSGTVVRAMGGPPVAGVRVLAWPSGEEPDLAEAVRAAGADPSTTFGVSGADGSFVVEGLAGDSTFCLAAAGDGYVGTEWKCNVAANAVGIKLGVRRAYAAVLHVRESGGALPRTAPSFHGRGFGTARWFDSGAEPVAFSAPQPWLAGIDPSWRKGLGMYDRLILFAAETEPEKVEPSRFRIALPGYEAGSLEFLPKPIAEGVPEYTLELVPKSDCFASLRVRFRDNLRVEGQVSTDFAPVGYVTLIAEDGTEAQFAVRDPWASEVTIPGVPCGKYSIGYVSDSSGFRYPRAAPHTEEFQVAADGASYDVWMTDVGAVDVAIVEQDGTPFIGRCGIGFDTLDDDGQTLARLPTRMFRRAPYLLSHVPSGRVGLRVIALDRNGDREPTLVTVLVAGGRVTQAQYQLPPR